MKKSLAFLCLMLCLSGCSKSGKDENPEKDIKSFVDLTAIKELDDGWYEYLYIVVDKKDKSLFDTKDNVDLNRISAVNLDVVNIKHKNIEGFYIPV